MKFSSPFRPAPAPPGFAKDTTTPERSAPLLSKLVFQWLVPFLDVGFSRPLERDDLWELPPGQLTSAVTDAVETNFFARCEPEKRPRILQDKLRDPGNLSISPSSTKEATKEESKEDTEKSGDTFKPSRTPTSAKNTRKTKYDSSLFLAIHRTFIVRIWAAGILKLCGDTLKTTTPLLTKVILTWLTNSYVYHRLSDEEKASGQLRKPQGIGYGIGLAVALFAMQGTSTKIYHYIIILNFCPEVASLLTNHYFQTSQTTGLLVRTGIIGNIFRKSLRISGRAKLDHSVGQITTMISTDAARLDQFSAFGHNLWLFNIIRAPLLFFPFVLSSLTDALVALRRISGFLLSDEIDQPYLLDHAQKYAVSVDGDFTWESAGKIGESKFSGGAERKDGKKEKKTKTNQEQSKKMAKDKPILPVSADDASEGTKDGESDKPFELQNLKFSVPKGAFVAIVGRVGSGKVPAQAIVGSVAYVPQTPWIRNATLRDNILFGREDDEQRFREIIRACNLEHDLEMLPNGELTEIGEKGINLSGGQKARVSLARAAYSQSDVILLDDPLSAVDAYVGKAILDQCLLNGPLSNRTRILVTHALHVLDKADYIYVLENGVVTEQGTYNALIQDSVVFARLIEEYGNLESEKEHGDGIRDKKTATGGQEDPEIKKDSAGALMQTEERNTGSVTWDVYGKYLRFAGGIIWAPIIITLLAVTQGAQVGNNLFLGFWTAQSIPGFRQGEYMAVYAGFGAAQAVFSFILSFAFA
ncbi:hypothetical protein H0H81_001750 [Sphagnurus paluster]|uniref:ABC transporter domain-containing protein n=1 Tax=Sphagnurus paluster TaxID=117069 RepID=A0A9P7GM51_9AGAR|nr:hypothetical protein H0H81_001750 [Sphagnurus paluster]